MSVSVLANVIPQERVERPLVIERVFTAPRDLVWKAWTEPEHLRHWWGPKGYSMLVMKLELRPGGVFHYKMRSPAGIDMWGKFAYREIEAPRRLVFISSFSDEMGKLVRNPMSATWPLEVINTLTLTDEKGNTKLTIKGRPFCTTETEAHTFKSAHDSIRTGFQGTFSQLDDYLARIMVNQYMEEVIE